MFDETGRFVNFHKLLQNTFFFFGSCRVPLNVKRTNQRKKFCIGANFQQKRYILYFGEKWIIKSGLLFILAFTKSFYNERVSTSKACRNTFNVLNIEKKTSFSEKRSRSYVISNKNFREKWCAVLLDKARALQRYVSFKYFLNSFVNLLDDITYK